MYVRSFSIYNKRMVADLKTFTGDDGRPTQMFRGYIYKLYESDPRYFISTRKKKTRLHVDVWSDVHGQRPPKGFHVHHVDDDKTNNHPDNLQLLRAGKHLSDHLKKRVQENPVYYQEMAKRIVKKAAEWSKTEKGLQFRREHVKNVLSKASKHLFEVTINKVCENCGKQYKAKLITEKTARFCKNSCKSAWRRKSGLDDEKRTCKHCGAEFVANKYSKTYQCSRYCKGQTASL